MKAAYWPLLTANCLLAVACSVTPLTNKIRVGEEPFVIAVGEGPDSMTDLFAAGAGPGAFVRLTFNRAEERTPRLSPSGSAVAFLRRAENTDLWSLVVLDLVTNREETAPMPKGAGKPQAVGWSRGGDLVLVKAYGYLVSPVPPRALWLRVVGLDSTAWADSLSSELLGGPPTARAGICRLPETGYCVFAGGGGEATRLPTATGAPIRWGPDSLAYPTAAGLEVRPLAGGRARHPIWNSSPSRLRDFTYHPGSGPRSPP